MNHVTSLFFLPVSVWTNERSLIQWRNSQIFSVYFYGLSKNLYPWCSAGPLHLELRLFTDEPKLSGHLRPVPSMRHVCRKLMVVVVIKTYTQSKMMNTTTVHDSLQGRIIDGIGFERPPLVGRPVVKVPKLLSVKYSTVNGLAYGDCACSTGRSQTWAVLPKRRALLLCGSGHLLVVPMRKFSIVLSPFKSPPKT